MYLGIDTPQHYFIEDILDFVGFLDAVQHLLDPEDCIVFSSYGSRPDVRAFLEVHQIEPDERVMRERDRLVLYQGSYPEAFAVRCVASPAFRNDLAELLRTCSDSTDFCDHIIAYGARGELFSFHDAFQSDPLLVSEVVPASGVAEFCRVLGVTSKLQPREAFFGAGLIVDTSESG
jgi:hypothetical protein